MIFLLTPLAVVAVMLMVFRPLRLLLGYVLLVLLILAIGAFGHVAWINANVWVAPGLALVVFAGAGRRPRS